MSMFKDDLDKTRKVNVEMTLEQLEFIHYVVTQIRDRVYNLHYYNSQIPFLERKRDYDKCNNILELLAIAHNGVKED